RFERMTHSGKDETIASQCASAMISRSIRDETIDTKYKLRETMKRPILKPSITQHELQPQDQFLIFASDRLWEQLTYQEVVDIVQNHSRNVCIRPHFPQEKKTY
ncbi:LOW QUALITY PROTEIN: hypothetical protein HID58_036042, partial [Brassica napus]